MVFLCPWMCSRLLKDSNSLLLPFHIEPAKHIIYGAVKFR